MVQTSQDALVKWPHFFSRAEVKVTYPVKKNMGYAAALGCFLEGSFQ